MNRFDRDTAVEPQGEGRFDCTISPGWVVERGPNGGYVSALLLRAIQAAVAEPARAPRSLNVHFCAPPRPGPAQIETRIERQGRTLSSVTARMLQGERLLALATAALALPRPGDFSYDDTRMPRVPPPEACPEIPARFPVHDRYESRRALGAEPFTGSHEKAAGGWIRLAEEPRAADALLLAAYADGWPPCVIARMPAGDPQPAGFPTIDLTVHFRSTPPAPGLAADAFLLTVFRSRLLTDGFFEEDGEIWSPDGQLLAHSRQLGALL
ncbi:MAG: thioesterase family protein [Myxococcales bacterium]|nr:thioesterase family protein [Myxococcales bacterium]